MIYTIKFIEPGRNPNATDENWKLTERGWECFVNGSMVVRPENAVRLIDLNAAYAHIAHRSNDSRAAYTYVVEELETI